MASLERRCFPAFGTCWIPAACHPPWTAVSSSAATQRIGAVPAVPAATGMLRQKLDVMRKEVEIAWPLQKPGIISKNKGLWIELIDQRRIRASEPVFLMATGHLWKGRWRSIEPCCELRLLIGSKGYFGGWTSARWCTSQNITKWQNPIMGHKVVPLQLCLLAYKCL